MNAEKIVALILLISLMFGAGLEVTRERALEIFKNYGLLARALVANFLIVPIIAVLLIRLFKLDDEIATGVLLMAIAPGVPFVILAAGRKKGGSLTFAVDLAVILPALSLITIPITAPLVLPPGEAAAVPPGHLVPILLFQVVPLLIGAVIGDRLPALAAKIARPDFIVTILSLLVLVVLLGPPLWHSITTVYGTRGMITELILVVLSLATGWLLGGPQRPFRRTLGIGTALRNIALALAIASSSFPGTAVAATCMTYLLVQALVVGLIGAYFARTRTPEAEVAA